VAGLNLLVGKLKFGPIKISRVICFIFLRPDVWAVHLYGFLVCFDFNYGPAEVKLS